LRPENGRQLNIKWTKMDSLIKPEKAQNSLSNPQKQTKKNLANCFWKSGGDSYYEVGQHEKFQFNILSFKRELNRESENQE
jgi:hypothetical protein